MAFHCEPIREYDENGQLIVAGAEWSEGDRTAQDKMPGIVLCRYIAVQCKTRHYWLIM